MFAVKSVLEHNQFDLKKKWLLELVVLFKIFYAGRNKKFFYQDNPVQIKKQQKVLYVNNYSYNNIINYNDVCVVHNIIHDF